MFELLFNKIHLISVTNLENPLNSRIKTERTVTQQAFPCSKSTIKTLEKGRRHDVSIVAFKQDAILSQIIPKFVFCAVHSFSYSKQNNEINA